MTDIVTAAFGDGLRDMIQRIPTASLWVDLVEGGVIVRVQNVRDMLRLKRECESAGLFMAFYDYAAYPASHIVYDDQGYDADQGRYSYVGRFVDSGYSEFFGIELCVTLYSMPFVPKV